MVTIDQRVTLAQLIAGTFSVLTVLCGSVYAFNNFQVNAIVEKSVTLQREKILQEVRAEFVTKSDLQALTKEVSLLREDFRTLSQDIKKLIAASAAARRYE